MRSADALPSTSHEVPKVPTSTRRHLCEQGSRCDAPQSEVTQAVSLSRDRQQRDFRA